MSIVILNPTIHTIKVSTKAPDSKNYFLLEGECVTVEISQLESVTDTVTGETIVARS